MKALHKTVFRIAKMDCPAEEQWVRQALDRLPGKRTLVFDLPNRQVTVVHGSRHEEISTLLAPLNFGHVLVSDESVEEGADEPESIGSAPESRALWMAFGINAFFFVTEVIVGILAHSLGLLADALDMLADAGVYGLSLLAVSASLNRKMGITLSAMPSRFGC